MKILKPRTTPMMVGEYDIANIKFRSVSTNSAIMKITLISLFITISKLNTNGNKLV